jgi:hypothetical protein
MAMGKRVLGLVLLSLYTACGGSTQEDGSAKAGSGGAAGSVAAGGSAGTGAGGVAVAGSSGTGASGGVGASGGISGASGSPGTCANLSYCDCKLNAATCQPVVEPCFCPCGIEPCEPACECDCGGGAYLGCTEIGVELPEEKFIGTWLIGWSGGMDHYSWVRLEPAGLARFLDGAELSGNAPFWNCNGAGSWHLAAKPDTVALYFPAGCDPAFAALTFANLAPATGYPPGAILTGSVEWSPTQTVEAYKFPDTQCDALMTTCTDPWL